MATKSWGTCRGHDWMWPPKLGLSRSIDRRVMTFLIFSNMAVVRHFEFWKKINTWSRDCHCGLICCCIPNFIKIGSRVRPPDAHNCIMFNAPLLGNGRCHGNRIMADMSGDDGMWPPKLRPSRSIGWLVMTFLIFSNMAAVRHFEFYKF